MRKFTSKDELIKNIAYWIHHQHVVIGKNHLIYGVKRKEIPSDVLGEVIDELRENSFEVIGTSLYLLPYIQPDALYISWKNKMK